MTKPTPTTRLGIHQAHCGFFAEKKPCGICDEMKRDEIAAAKPTERRNRTAKDEDKGRAT